MRNKEYLALFILLLSCSTLFGQGRVETDAILANIRWHCWKIDNDKSIKYSLETVLSQKIGQEVIAYYSKKDTVYKIVKLKGIDKGSEQITCYFISEKPSFILVEQNNYSYSANMKDYPKILSSFEDIIDSSAAKNKSPYSIHYKASYYFSKRKPYYVNIMEREKIRINKESDKRNALLLFYEEMQLLELFLRDHVFDMTFLSKRRLAKPTSR